MDNNFLINNNNGRKGQRRKQLTVDNITIEDELKKKEMHRDIEKKRRQEMGQFFTSLRSLLPLEYIKGKRAMSDHVNEAAKYVKDLENNVARLTGKRDELKKLSNLTINATASTSATNTSSTYVVVNPCFSGFEILINGEDFPLSRVLQVLFDEGLDVISYSCSTVDERLLHIIYTEVNDNDITYVDISELHQKLTRVIN
ncbi:hypothetical protein ACFE04_028260 [Oxalis oulophora]